MSDHNPDCDVNDFNLEGIKKPCNCGAQSSLPASTYSAAAITCACVNPDPRECARMRDGPQYYDLKRLCECVCHKDYDDEDDDWN